MFFFKNLLVFVSDLHDGVIFTSLKVVSIAVSFFTETSRWANFNLNVDIFFLSISRVPPHDDGDEETELDV
ncbi:MAG: hypothetical protein R2750_09830 [Bacteroidales bacterium]